MRVGLLVRSVSIPLEGGSHVGHLSNEAISSGKKWAVLIKQLCEGLNKEAI